MTIKEFNQLEDEEKEGLTKQKELVDKLLTAFAEEMANRQQKEEKGSWYHHIPWTSVIWYGCGILMIVLVFGWLQSKTKGK